MEKFGLVVDYGRNRLQWGDSKWTPVRQKNNTSHYLLNLAEDLNTLRTNLRRPEFQNLPNDVEDALLEMDEESSGNNLDHNHDDDDTEDDSHTKPLKNNQMKPLCHVVDCAYTTLNKAVAPSTRKLCRRRRVWEIFAGIGLVTQYFRTYGCEVSQYGYETGWDLTDQTHQQQLLCLMDTEEPDEIWMTPDMEVWMPAMENDATRPRRDNK